MIQKLDIYKKGKVYFIDYYEIDEMIMKEELVESHMIKKLKFIGDGWEAKEFPVHDGDRYYIQGDKEWEIELMYSYHEDYDLGEEKGLNIKLRNEKEETYLCATEYSKRTLRTLASLMSDKQRAVVTKNMLCSEMPELSRILINALVRRRKK